MDKNLHPIPARDPVSGGDLYISELANDESGIQLRGRFAVPKYARLDADQANFLDTFLRCRGTINAVEKELGMSYPTVRARLDQLLNTLGLAPLVVDEKKTDPPVPKVDPEKMKSILDQLETGEISAEEAKAQMRAKE